MPGVYFPQVVGTLHVVLDDGTDFRVENQPVDFRPRTANVIINDYHTPGTFEITFDAKYLPFSPEILRTVGVELYGFRTNGLVDTSDLKPYKTDDNLLMAGIVQEVEVENGNNGRHFRCRGSDYTMLLAGRRYDIRQSPVSPQGSLKETVQRLVDDACHVNFNVPSGPGDISGQRVLKVRMVGFDRDEPTIDVADTKAISAAQKPWPKNKKLRKPKQGSLHEGSTNLRQKQKPYAGKDGSYWDVINLICRDHGLIVYVRGTDVVISTPQNLTDTVDLRYRRVAYGRNIRDIKVSRKLGAQSVPVVKVTSYDTNTDTAISAQFPDEADATAKVRAVSVRGLQVQWDRERSYVVHGITDRARLRDIAKMHFAHLGRQEQKISFSTRDLTDLDGSDMLLLRPADPVKIEFDDRSLMAGRPEELRGSQNQQQVYGAVKAAMAITGNSGPSLDRLAQEMSRILTNPNGFGYFYTLRVVFDWDQKQGLDIQVDCKNFSHEEREEN